MTQTETLNDKKLLTTSEAARRVGVERHTIARWIAADYLPATRKGARALMIDPDVLEALLAGLNQYRGKKIREVSRLVFGQAKEDA